MFRCGIETGAKNLLYMCNWKLRGWSAQNTHRNRINRAWCASFYTRISSGEGYVRDRINSICTKSDAAFKFYFIQFICIFVIDVSVYEKKKMHMRKRNVHRSQQKIYSTCTQDTGTNIQVQYRIPAYGIQKRGIL